MLNFIDTALKKASQKKQLRRLVSLTRNAPPDIYLQGKKYLDFSCNNYLGLANHPLLIERSIEYIQKYGTSSMASRLISGNLNCFEKIEKKVALLKKTEDALIFNSGYQANVTIIPAIANRSSLILMDRLCHNSLIQGAKLSHSKILRFNHNNFLHLEKLLSLYHNKYASILIITESLFSMEGDMSDLDTLVQIAKRYRAILYVDDAHATGILGENGMGLTVGKKIDIAIGTFGKALGSFGAYVATSSLIKQYLINFCSGIIYSTALPPSILGAIDAALDLIPYMDKERKKLLKHGKIVRQALKDQKWNYINSTSPIVPLLTKDEKSSLLLHKKLLKRKIFAVAIRPPTVPPGQSRIRFSLSSCHSTKDINYLIQTLSLLAKEHILCQKLK